MTTTTETEAMTFRGVSRDQKSRARLQPWVGIWSQGHKVRHVRLDVDPFIDEDDVHDYAADLTVFWAGDPIEQLAS